MPSTVVTLLVSPDDAERIALAQTEGSITLVLRNPLDVTPTETQRRAHGGADGRAGARARCQGGSASTEGCRRRAGCGTSTSACEAGL